MTVNNFRAKVKDAAGHVGERLEGLHNNSERVPKGAGNKPASTVNKTRSPKNSSDAKDVANKKVDEYEIAIMEYNRAYTDMSDCGTQLHQERKRSSDLLSLVEALVNSIANSPKEFGATFEKINVEKTAFTQAEQYAKDELNAARRSTLSAGGGIAAGAALASMAPSAAMWVATTFGTASTGTAISTLSGAAASQAALAWLGGGALAAGGAGTAGGSALLALAGPIGWGIAGATLLASIILFARKSFRLKAQKNEELLSIKRNTVEVRDIGERIGSLMRKTSEIRARLDKEFLQAMPLYGSDYSTLKQNERARLGVLVNNSKSLGMLLTKTLNENE